MRTLKTRQGKPKKERRSIFHQLDPVERTPELVRILGLPRREWEPDEVEEYVEAITDMYKTPQGQWRVRPLQAMALVELHDFGGLLAVILVGGGKTLVTYLASTMLEAERPLLLIPGGLEDKTKYDFEKLREHFVYPENLRIETYEQISLKTGPKLLKKIAPDLILADEVYALKNPTSAVTQHVGNYVMDHEDVDFCGLSGTLSERSLMEIHHLLQWTHTPETIPLPASRKECETWAQALDEKVKFRRKLGALKLFVPEGEVTTLENVRIGFGQHLRNSPGYLASTGSDVGASIEFSFWSPKIPDFIQAALKRLKSEYVMPDGQICVQPVEVWRHVREIVCGFYYKWAEPAPKAWLHARKVWYRFYRRAMENRSLGLASPAQVEDAVLEGRLVDPRDALRRWKEVEDTYKPKTIPVWMSDSVVNQIAERIPDGPALIWTESTALGEKLAEVTGLSYFGRKGLDANGRYIERLEGKESAILSISSNKKGRNLQAWSHNMVLPPPPNNVTTEQYMGRTHREGQLADVVTYDCMFGDAAIDMGFYQAIRYAMNVKQLYGVPQKLLLGLTTNPWLVDQALNYSEQELAPYQDNEEE